MEKLFGPVTQKSLLQISKSANKNKNFLLVLFKMTSVPSIARNNYSKRYKANLRKMCIKTFEDSIYEYRFLISTLTLQTSFQSTVTIKLEAFRRVNSSGVARIPELGGLDIFQAKVLTSKQGNHLKCFKPYYLVHFPQSNTTPPHLLTGFGRIS